MRSSTVFLPVLIAASAVGLSSLPSPGQEGRGGTDDPAAREKLALSSDLRVGVRQGRILELEVRPAAGEGYAGVAARVTAGAAAGPLISDWNSSAPPSPGSFVRVPLSLLSDDYRALVLLNLFPRDHREGENWVHVARAGALPTYDEGLWQVAEWFTDSGGRFTEIQAANHLDGPDLRPGQEVRIPGRLLRSPFRAGPRSADGSLEYGADARGPYAGYRLRAGEALYSAVVVRFTGRTSADDVMALAGSLAERSGIRDPTDIPIRQLVKIPFDVLEPEYLPEGHPRRLEAEAQKKAMAQALAKEPVPGTRGGLDGVVVIIDPGHGGRDLGTMNHGIWEHDYVYDVACRLKTRLERRTKARVYLTLEDAETGCLPSSGDKLRANRQGTVRTHPPFLAKEDGEAAIAVNLRWYLANSILRKVSHDGIGADRVVFISLHADARHPSLRGVMVYVPGARFRTGSYGHTSATYRRFSEVREKPKVKFSHRGRVRSEAVSRKLAREVVAAFRDEGLPVQPYKPVRDCIIRGHKQWVPAVLRGNEVPAKILVEMVNLTNRADASLLAAAAERDRLAQALFSALFRYFGERPPAKVEPEVAHRPS